MPEEFNTALDRRGRARVQTQFLEPSLTVQSDAINSDIQEILRPYGPVGLAQVLDQTDEMFLDVSEFTDYADMARQTRDAEMAFMRLPSKVREAFDHDVMNWLDAAHDKEKRTNVMERLGLVVSPAGGNPAGGEAGGAPQPVAAPPADIPSGSASE